MVDEASRLCDQGFRIQIINNTCWVTGESPSFQTRALSVKMMIYTLAQRFVLPDVDFVVSIHDFPHPATKDRTLPVFAMGKTKEHKVILFPDHTFWNWYEASTKNWPKTAASLTRAARKIAWSDKVGKALFSGAPTAPMRAAMARVSVGHPELFELRIHEQERSKFITLQEHCKHKYLLHLAGITYSARLKYLLLCNSTVIAPALGKTGSQQPGGWIEFYYQALESGVHFIDSENSSNTVVVLRQLEQDQDYARQIASRGAAWAQQNLNMDSVWGYWRDLLAAYASKLEFIPVVHPEAVPLADSLLSTNPTRVIRPACATDAAPAGG
jgi:hypothetical protein